MHEKNINTLLSLANACYCKTAVCDVYGCKPGPNKEAAPDIVNEKPVNRLQGKPLLQARSSQSCLAKTGQNERFRKAQKPL